MVNTGDFYEDGYCPIPKVYETEKHQIIIYDHEGNPLIQEKIPLGFDLRVRE